MQTAEMKKDYAVAVLDPAGNAATYGDASIPLGAQVAPAVADFILTPR